MLLDPFLGALNTDVTWIKKWILVKRRAFPDTFLELPFAINVSLMSFLIKT